MCFILCKAEIHEKNYSYLAIHSLPKVLHHEEIVNSSALAGILILKKKTDDFTQLTEHYVKYCGLKYITRKIEISWIQTLDLPF